MVRIIGVLLASSLAICCSLASAQNWWESQPFASWSDKQVIDMIEGPSPWTALSSTFWLRVEVKKFIDHPEGTDNRASYRMLFLTARPVREAILRSIALNQRIIGLAELKNRDPEAEQERLLRFIESNPDSFIVKADKEHIIASLILIFLPYSDYIGNRKGSGAGEFPEVNRSKLMADTFLETDTGRRVLRKQILRLGES